MKSLLPAQSVESRSSTGASLTALTAKVAWPSGGLGIGRTGAGAVVRNGIVERGGAVEIGGRRELDVAVDDRDRAADGVGDGGDRQRLGGFVGRPGVVIGGEFRELDDVDAAVLGDRGEDVGDRHRHVVDLCHGDGGMADGGLRIGGAVGGAVVLHGIIERSRAVEIGRWRELDVAVDDRDGAADGVADAVTVRVWPASSVGPAMSLPVRAENAMVAMPLSSATGVSESAAAVGASLTAVTVKETWPTSVLGSGLPNVVPLSCTV